MCGIVGAVAESNIINILLEGLKRLEYRGYDSAGIAWVDAQHHLQRLRTQGKVAELNKLVKKQKPQGHIGIAHTRWATHGKPCEHNAHPHMSNDRIALVHNGIIENYQTLYDQLKKQGYTFTSETDTEVIAHIIHQHIEQGDDVLTAVQKTVKSLDGAYAIGVIDIKQPNTLIAARKGSPLVIGIGSNQHYIASDMLALLAHTQEFIYMEDGYTAKLTHDSLDIYNEKNKKIKPVIHKTTINHSASSRGNYRHFMLKEIYEQPQAIIDTLSGRVSDKHVLPEAFGTTAQDIFSKIKHIHIVACGTSYHAGFAARYWLESIAGIPCHVEIASEFRYREVVVPSDTLFVTLSQSGETADTLAALLKAKKLSYRATLSICNTPESSLTREAELVFITQAGPEIGVASTKAFTTQLLGLLLLTITIARCQKKTIPEAEWISHLHHLPTLINDILTLEKPIKALAKGFVDQTNTLFLGRGIHYPIALEGALKLKEVSYIHAEAYPAGELKHGPLAMVDDDMPVIVVAPNDELFAKLKSNIEEVCARGGQLYVFADKTLKLPSNDNVKVIGMPAIPNIIAPIAYVIPLQLFAYHVAVIKGTDVDQPRNLAKAVTVE